MKRSRIGNVYFIAIVTGFFCNCTSYPTLIEVARVRQNSGAKNAQDLKDAKGDSPRVPVASVTPGSEPHTGITPEPTAKPKPKPIPKPTPGGTPVPENTTPTPTPSPSTNIHVLQQELIKGIAKDSFSPEQAKDVLTEFAPSGFDLTGGPKKRLHVLISHTVDPVILSKMGEKIPH